jgi:murein DD-endopeptidase MepM/ murein hydrolase activator NlpD
MVSAQELVYPKLKYRFRKSAAMMGLAISIGASSVLFSQMGDEAMAAEPITAKSNATPKKTVAIGQQVPADSEALKALATSQNVEASFALPDRSVREILTANSAIRQTEQSPANNTSPDNSQPSVPLGVSEQQFLSDRSTLLFNSSEETAERVAPETNNLPESGGGATTEISQPTPVASQIDLSAETSIPNSIVSEEAGSSEANNLESSANETEEQEVSSSTPSPTATQSTTPLLPRSNVTEPQAVEPVAVYKVKRGDTLSAIAETYGISISELLRMNNLKAADSLEIDQQLIVPASKSTASNRNFSVGPNSVGGNSLGAEPSNSAIFESASTANIDIAVNKPLVGLKPTVAQETGLPREREAIAPLPESRPTTPQGSNLSAPSESEGIETEISQLRERYVTQSRPAPSNGSNQEEPAIAIPVMPPGNDDARWLQPNRQPATSGPNNLNAREDAVEISVPPPINNSRIRPAVAPAPVRPINSSRPSLPVAAPGNYRPIQPINRPPAAVRPTSFGSQNLAAVEIPVPVPATNVIPRRRSQIAAAPTRTDDYNPMLRTPAGQPVSPDLPDGTAPRSNGLIWPAKGVLTSGYGMRWGRMHKGIDIAAPVGTPIFAAGPGTVLRSTWSGGYGNLVEIQHPDGTITRYGHNSRLIVQAGQQVEQGQLIALMGSTGRSTGPHCHFEVRPGGRDAVNPIAYLPRRSRGG